MVFSALCGSSRDALRGSVRFGGTSERAGAETRPLVTIALAARGQVYGSLSKSNESKDFVYGVGLLDVRVAFAVASRGLFCAFKRPQFITH